MTSHNDKLCFCEKNVSIFGYSIAAALPCQILWEKLMHLNIIVSPIQYFCYGWSRGLLRMVWHYSSIPPPPPVPLNLASNVVDSRRGELNLFFPWWWGTGRGGELFSPPSLYVTFQCDEEEGGISLLLFWPYYPSFASWSCVCRLSSDCLRKGTLEEIIHSVSRIKAIETRWLFSSHFWPLLKQASFFEAAGK